MVYIVDIKWCFFLILRLRLLLVFRHFRNEPNLQCAFCLYVFILCMNCLQWFSKDRGFIHFRFIIWLESLAEWKVNYFPGILVLFCELKPKFSHKNFKNAKRHHAKQGCFWSCQVCLYSKAMQCEFFPAFFLVGILIVCMQCGMVCKQIMSFCSSLDKGKTQMFDFPCKTLNIPQVSC